MDILKLIEESLKGNASISLINDVALIHGCGLDEVINTAAVTIANDFQNGLINFDDADFIMNELWTVMVDLMSKDGAGGKLPNPAYSIYDAFDQGEFVHKDGKDPIEYHTKRLLKEILSDV